MRFNHRPLLLDRGEKGVYSSYTLKEKFVNEFAEEDEYRKLLLRLWSPAYSEAEGKEIFALIRKGFDTHS
jgi:hypothetical protein